MGVMKVCVILSHTSTLRKLCPASCSHEYNAERRFRAATKGCTLDFCMALDPPRGRWLPGLCIGTTEPPSHCLEPSSKSFLRRRPKRNGRFGPDFCCLVPPWTGRESYFGEEVPRVWASLEPPSHCLEPSSKTFFKEVSSETLVFQLFRTDSYCLEPL